MDWRRGPRRYRHAIKVEQRSRQLLLRRRVVDHGEQLVDDDGDVRARIDVDGDVDVGGPIMSGKPRRVGLGLAETIECGKSPQTTDVIDKSFLCKSAFTKQLR
ncbi:hypothetical protein MES5069_360157 [Mesorhizobium escarrei]|uniref:Uncharacterized protein n=1 Tax=Mesorhizobium escarrei TaxID=666018 RepID=A0ABM9E249_9HYPH|nr:hypothetical protein MES5069_360157 [Mesorhizobium escarrei]